MTKKEIIKWLLRGDVAIQYQVHKNLLSDDRKDLRDRIAHEGWGKKFLSRQNKNGHWGRSYYQPKWTSTHYVLLDLKNLAINPQNPAILKTIDIVLDEEKGPDGGINTSPTILESDVCLNGMFLNFAAYFKSDEKTGVRIISCSITLG